MKYGIRDKILRINLSQGDLSTESLGDGFFRRYFGGRGLIAYILLKELNPGIDPLSSKNKLVFACGPITGAPISGSGRNSIGAKSPLTLAYGDAEVGGYWGAEFKRSGFDALIIEGKSDEPVYIWIHDGEVELREAASLWGLETKKSQQKIQEEIGEKSARVAQIGPGGEKMVRFACIINDLSHAGGRCGLGAVMGSKNLKAIAVRGTQPVNIANPQEIRTLAKYMAKNSDNLAHDLITYGTGAAMDAFEELGILPVRNFRDGTFPQVDSISAQAIKEKFGMAMGRCFACSLSCKKTVALGEPWNVDPDYGGPEYETLAALGSNCGIDNLEAICKVNELCQKYSLDTISSGVVIAFAMECFEQGLLNDEDMRGIKLGFGNAEAMLQILEKIGKREGIGDILAEGVKRAVDYISDAAKELAIHVKGLEVPMHDPRVKKGLGLGYAVSPTGADHVSNIHDTYYSSNIPEREQGLGILEPVPIEDLGPNKVRLFKLYMTWRNLNNCLVMCLFPPWTVQEKIKIVQAVTGWNTTAYELMKVSQRANNMARIFNLREGFSEEDDWLPPRFFKPTTSGVLSDTAINPMQLTKAKILYYAMEGWNKNGVPMQATLEELGIGWASEYLRDSYLIEE